jgi:hypothetical protein
MAKENSIELFAIRYSPIRYQLPYKGDPFAYNRHQGEGRPRTFAVADHASD